MKFIVSLLKQNQWLRFLLSGGVNTVFSYTVYLICSLWMSYQAAYLMAYLLAFVLAYWFNARIVFQAPLSWQGLFSYPIVYVVQYVMSAISLELLVSYLHFSYIIAPLVVSVIMIPISYIVTKYIINASIPFKVNSHSHE